MGENKGKNQQKPQDENQLKKVRREKLATLMEEGRNPYEITKYNVTDHTEDVRAKFAELEAGTPEGEEPAEVLETSLAGRMMSKRVMGKASFCNLQDLKGNIQIYVARDILGEDPYKDFKKLDVGDLIGVEGEVFRTHTGEVSVKAKKITLLSKSLSPLPEKFHGLTNTDIRYRQRYVDLIMNPKQRIPLSRDQRSSVPSVLIWTDRASWKWKRPCW